MLVKFIDFKNQKKCGAIVAFYALSLGVLLQLVPEILRSRHDIEAIDWYWPMLIFKPLLNESLYLLLLWGLVVAMIVPILRPEPRATRILGAAAWLLAIAMAFPIGLVWNSILLWPGIAIALAWPNMNFSGQVRRGIFIAQSYALSVYFCSGLWKLRRVIVSALDGKAMLTLTESIPYGVALGVAENTVKTDWLMRLTNEYPSFSGALWILVIAFQLSTVVGILAPSTLPFFGISLILFHFAAGIFFGPIFGSQVVAVGYLFLITPLFDSGEDQSPAPLSVSP